MQLTRIQKITGKIVLKTGLHIGAGDTEMRIGGTDNPVVKDPLTGQPYIPGSSLKGKIRSLLEWRTGAVQPTPLAYKDIIGKSEAQCAQIIPILKLFGLSGGDKEVTEEIARKIGPTRLAFWDCPLNLVWKKEVADARNLLITEAKSEVAINRISGTAQDGALRFTERVIAGAEFDFALTLKVIDDEDLLPMLQEGLALLQRDSLGGSGSRGYGKIEFLDLACDGQALTLPDNPFAGKPSC